MAHTTHNIPTEQKCLEIEEDFPNIDVATFDRTIKYRIEKSIKTLNKKFQFVPFNVYSNSMIETYENSA